MKSKHKALLLTLCAVLLVAATAFGKPSCGRRDEPIHSILYSVAYIPSLGF